MNKGRIGGLIFLGVGVYGIVFASQLPMGRWNEPGPGVFPMALAVLLSISGVLGVMRKEPGAKMGVMVLRPLLKPIQIVGLTLAYIIILEPAGFLLTTFLFLLLLFVWVSRYRLAISVGMAAGCTVVGWVLFVKILGLLLPRTFLGV